VVVTKMLLRVFAYKIAVNALHVECQKQDILSVKMAIQHKYSTA
jgi:hypothetical protein